MKYLVTVILSLSLYAPQVAKFLAYAECSALAVTVQDINWCDCMISADTDTDTDGIPATEKQKDIQLKTDWKFTAGKNIAFAEDHFTTDITPGSFYNANLPKPYGTAIFHPPLD